MMGVGLCAALAACADRYVTNPATTTSGNWKIEKQIDRITGVPVGTVMSRLSRARARLRELMDGAPAGARKPAAAASPTLVRMK